MELSAKEVWWCRCNGPEKQKNVRIKIDTGSGVITLTNERNETDVLFINRFVKRSIPLNGAEMSIEFNTKHPLYKDLPGRPLSLKLVLDDGIMLRAVGRMIMDLMEKFESGEYEYSRNNVAVVDTVPTNRSMISGTSPSNSVSSSYIPEKRLKRSIPVVQEPHSCSNGTSTMASANGARSMFGTLYKVNTPPRQMGSISTQLTAINNNSTYILLSIKVEEVVWLRERELHRKCHLNVKINRNTATISISDKKKFLVEYHIDQFETRDFAPTGAWVALVFDKKHPSYSNMDLKAEVLKIKLGDDENVYKNVVTIIKYMMEHNEAHKKGHI